METIISSVAPKPNHVEGWDERGGNCAFNCKPTFDIQAHEESTGVYILLTFAIEWNIINSN